MSDLMLYPPKPGDRVRLTYGDGGTVEGVWEVSEDGRDEFVRRDDGTVHNHVSGHVRRSIIARSDKAPAHPYDGAGWIVERHEWAQEIVGRVVGSLEPTHDDEGAHWLDRLAQAINDRYAWGLAWDEYKARTREPEDDAAWDAWEQAGPQPTPGARAFGVMSSGEKRLARLIATLSIHKTPWSVEEIGFDERGARILLDWLAIVRAQLPEFLYDPNYDPDAVIRRMQEKQAARD
jgi:hypothetical protein